MEKACNHTYLNKRGSVYDKQEKRREKRPRLEKKRRVKYGLRTSRKRFGLSTESSEGSSASAPQKKVEPALEIRSKAAGACLEASS